MEILRIRNNPSEEWQEIAAIKGADGKDYVLTNEDKDEIANIVLSLLVEAEGVGF